MLNTAIEAAHRAGRIIAEQYPIGRCDVRQKGFRDLVTETDTAAEAVIIEIIKHTFPDHAILSEEAGVIPRAGEYTWVVDPLDGTTNFAHHHPVFAVSIAIAKGDIPIVAVIYDPMRDQTFVARQGAGATLNGQLIRTSPIKRLEDAMVAMDWGHTNAQREQMLGYLHPTLMGCGTVRSMGSAALALAYVAAGRLDAYFQAKLNPWDVAAGTLLIREAGGRCTTLTGTPHRMDLPDCLATNGHIHDALLEVIRAADKKR
jgi:myo-inositol-1(or 4)-monophosphatase